MDQYGTQPEVQVQKKPSRLIYLVPVFLVGVALSFFAWNLFGYTETGQTSSLDETQETCSGSIDVKSLTYDGYSDSLNGVLENTGGSDLENLILTTKYSDGSDRSVDVCDQGLCFLPAGERARFSVTLANDNYVSVTVDSSCASDSAGADEVMIIG